MPEFDPARLGVFMVTYRRPKICAKTLRDVLATTPAAVLIQTNHDDFPIYRHIDFDVHRPAVLRGPRPNESPGHLAADWNRAARIVFDREPVDLQSGWAAGTGGNRGWTWPVPCPDWLWCLHDDMVIEPGWIDVVADAARDGVRWFHAPGGDMSFLLHRSIWETVGPWDERFPGTGWKEWDYYIRVLQAIPRDQVVMEDTHGDGFAINHLGLSRFWRGKSGEGHLFAADPEWHQARGDKECDAVFAAHDVFVAKWGVETMREIERTDYRCFGDPGWVAAQKAAW